MPPPDCPLPFPFMSIVCQTPTLDYYEKPGCSSSVTFPYIWHFKSVFLGHPSWQCCPWSSGHGHVQPQGRPQEVTSNLSHSLVLLPFAASPCPAGCPLGPLGPFLQSCFPSSQSQLVLFQGCFPSLEQWLAFFFGEAHEAPFSPFLQPAHVLLHRILDLVCIE